MYLEHFFLVYLKRKSNNHQLYKHHHIQFSAENYRIVQSQQRKELKTANYTHGFFE